MTKGRIDSYFPTVNVIRAAAVLMICLYHFAHYSDFRGKILPDGDPVVAFSDYAMSLVHLFFVVSGFVIPLSLHRSNYSLGKFHRFILRRLIRLEIPYLVSISLFLAVSAAFLWKNDMAYSIDLSRLAHHIFFSVQFSDYEWYNPIFWTLAIELQFYILVGLIYPLLVHKSKLFPVLTVLLFGATALLLPEFNYVSYFAPQFAQGLVLFLLISDKLTRLPAYAFILLLACLTAYVSNVEIAVICLLGILLVDFVKIDHPWLNRLGDISYSLYLVHGLIGGNLLYFLWKYTDSIALIYLMIALSLIASTAFAYYLWKLVEKPSLRLSRKIKL